MSIAHHPSDLLLTASAAGTLGLGEHIAVATHIQGCARCREWMRMTEALGGAILENIPPAPMAGDPLSLLESRLAHTPPEVPVAAPSRAIEGVPGLPDFVRRYPAGEWKWIAPGLHLLPLHVPETGDVRVFLLKAKPGVKFLPHRHTGVEMTCVLMGSFSHDDAQFRPGDFDLGDADTDHVIAIGAGMDCLCLVSMSGELRLKGLLGRMAQPFVSI